MSRITVSNIYELSNPIELIHETSCEYVSLCGEYLIVNSKECVMRYQLNGFMFVDSVNIKQLLREQISIIKVLYYRDLLIILLAGRNDILVLSKSNYYFLGGHIDAISCLLLVDRYLVSGSADFTIRLWNMENVSSEQFHNCQEILISHTNNVTCLEGYYGLFVSGGEDGLIILWKKNYILSQYFLESKVTNIKSCYQSQQLIVSDINGSIWVMSMKQLLEKKKGLEMLRKICINNLKCILSICQIDDSFIGCTDGEFIYFIEINLGMEIRRVKWSGIVCLDCSGKIMIGGKHHNGVELIKL